MYSNHDTFRRTGPAIDSCSSSAWPPPVLGDVSSPYASTPKPNPDFCARETCFLSHSVAVGVYRPRLEASEIDNREQRRGSLERALMLVERLSATISTFLVLLSVRCTSSVLRVPSCFPNPSSLVFSPHSTTHYECQQQLQRSVPARPRASCQAARGGLKMAVEFDQ